jgi:hypothetical protein
MHTILIELIEITVYSHADHYDSHLLSSSIQGDKTVATEAQAPDKVLTADWDQNKALFQKIQRCKLGPADPRGVSELELKSMN